MPPAGDLIIQYTVGDPLIQYTANDPTKQYTAGEPILRKADPNLVPHVN
jgi:hypothetical protein